MKREKVEYMPPVQVGAGPGQGGMRLPPPHASPHAAPPTHAPHDYRDRFPATPRLQVNTNIIFININRSIIWLSFEANY